MAWAGTTASPACINAATRSFPTKISTVVAFLQPSQKSSFRPKLLTLYVSSAVEKSASLRQRAPNTKRLPSPLPLAFLVVIPKRGSAVGVVVACSPTCNQLLGCPIHRALLRSGSPLSLLNGVRVGGMQTLTQPRSRCLWD